MVCLSVKLELHIENLAMQKKMSHLEDKCEEVLIPSGFRVCWDGWPVLQESPEAGGWTELPATEELPAQNTNH